MIYQALSKLIDYATKCRMVEECDIFVVRNCLMEMLRLSDWCDSDACWQGESIDELLSPVIEYAVSKIIIEDTTNSKDLFDTKIMGIFTPKARKWSIISR